MSSKPNLLVLYNPALKFSGVDKLMGRIGGDEKLGRQLSPTLNLTKDTPPALLLFGTKDFLLGQGKEWIARAKKLGHDSELYLAEDQKHGFFNREPWRSRTTERMDDFLVKHKYLMPNTLPGDT